MPTIYQSINNQALNYIHRLQSTKMPNAIYTMYRIPTRVQRTTHTLRPIYAPKTKKLKESLFFKYTIIYNQLPHAFKELPKVKFKRQIKIYIRDNKEYHIIPDTSTGDSDESE